MKRPEVPHYTQGEIEYIDAVRAMLGDETFVDHCRATAMKYLWRARVKDDVEGNLGKARDYLNFALEVLDGTK